jgi:trehalose-6-phosphatase
MEELRSIVNLAGITYAAKHGLEIAGPRVEFLHVRPAVSWSKGSAVKWILDQTGMDQPAAIYIGNHRTDEDVFRELPKSITVNVRRRRGTTSARYFVKSPDGGLLFLENLPLIEQSSRIPARTLHSTLRAAIG